MTILQLAFVYCCSFLSFSGIIAERVDLRSFLTIGMIGMSLFSQMNMFMCLSKKQEIRMEAGYRYEREGGGEEAVRGHEVTKREER